MEEEKKKLIELLEERKLHLPELYRQELIRLSNLREEESSYEWVDLLYADELWVACLLIDIKDAYLKSCYQEGLAVINEMQFFLGFKNEVPNLVGGFPPVMSRDAACACDGACVNWGSELSANLDGMSLFMLALKRRCKVCIDKALLIWVEELQGCEGGYISWVGDLPTAENLRLSDLFYLVSSSEEWYKDDFLLNINALLC